MSAKATIEAVEHYLNIDGLKFHYVEWGDSAAPPIVMLHGLRSYAMTFEPIAESLSAKFRIVALDQRGRGWSDWDPSKRYYTESYVNDLASFVDRIGLKRFHLLGHSMGGTNSIVYASRHPARVISLIVEDMGPGASAASNGAERIKRELAETPMYFRDLESARGFWRRIRPNVTDEAIESRVRYSLHVMDDGTVHWRHDQAGISFARLNPSRASEVNLWECLERVPCPMLLVRGAESDFLSSETATEMTNRCTRLTRVDVSGAGHYVHDDQPEAFLAAVQRFFARHNF